MKIESIDGWRMYEVFNDGTLHPLPQGNRRFLARADSKGVTVLCYLTLKKCHVSANQWAWCGAFAEPFDAKLLQQALWSRLKNRDKVFPAFRTIHMLLLERIQHESDDNNSN
jgi:hypothetical protein